METREILELVKSGAMSVEEAEGISAGSPLRTWALRNWICTERSDPAFRK